MTLKLLDATGQVVASMLDDDSLLGSYNPQDYYTIHIVDSDPSTISYDNVNEIPKYQISEEAYDSLDVNFRKFKQEKIKAGVIKTNQNAVDDDFQYEKTAGVDLGQRCRINPGDKRGAIRYIGKIPNLKPGWFFGIELDEPLGKNDGSYSGTRYFQCPPNHGTFVRPSTVEIGDFKPYDEDSDEF
jgi:tubulin-specific chaperone B